MSHSAPDRTTFEAIEAYVLDRMGSEERAAFGQRLAGDPALRAEVDLEREHMLAVELGGLQRSLKAIGDAELRRGGGPAWGGLLKYAAGIAVLLGVALWWMMRPPAHERLFAEHFTPDPGLPVAMSATDDHAFHDAMVAYKLGEHDEAIAKWSAQLKAKPSNDTLRFYIGCAELNTGRASKAVTWLMPIAELPGSAFATKARWYAFLALVRHGDLTAARALPFPEDHPYAQRAKAVLNDLR
ncbi:MAG: hypothetical protein IPJ87_11820 [Flavobacteriales bacterium]|nr:hypothetical protein [Flavobacteriales bacterium]MBK7942538.1 hypothetical protein [Flavobacteriales bacterium]MBK8950942.1 hypothetical protein [Flavobacteriales bacterium]MBK9699061.1 hypothetical protein [Flavobacteriales bacterium]